MTTHYDDEAQAEALKRWWTENWKALAGGLVIGLGAIFGWEQWQDRERGTAQQASQMYEDLKKAQAGGKADEARALADRLAAEHAGTPYAVDGALQVAGRAAESGQLDEALTRLRWAESHTDNAGLKPLLRLRIARVLWQQGQVDEALKQLDGEAAGYAALFEELRGDIQLARGDRAAARAAYEKALGAAGEQAANRELLQQKLDDLADQAAAPVARS